MKPLEEQSIFSCRGEAFAPGRISRPLEEQSINTIQFICVHLCSSAVKNQKLEFLQEV
jgi:hypothetical protein